MIMAQRESVSDASVGWRRTRPERLAGSGQGLEVGSRCGRMRTQVLAGAILGESEDGDVANQGAVTT